MMITRTAKVYGVISLIFMLGSLAVLGFALHYVQTEGARLEAEVAVVADHAARAQSYQDLQQTVRESSSSRAELRSRVLTEDRTITFLTDIEHEAKHHGVHLVTDSLKPSSGKGTFSTLAMSFSLFGPSDAVRHMINMFETLPYYGQVTNVSFTENNDSTTASSTAHLTLSVSLLNK